MGRFMADNTRSGTIDGPGMATVSRPNPSGIGPDGDGVEAVERAADGGGGDTDLDIPRLYALTASGSLSSTLRLRSSAPAVPNTFDQKWERR